MKHTLRAIIAYFNTSYGKEMKKALLRLVIFSLVSVVIGTVIGTMTNYADGVFSGFVAFLIIAVVGPEVLPA